MQEQKKYLSIQTFTYFIPAPTQNRKGYREKEFDKIFYDLTQYGFELIEMKTESIDKGLWVICLLGATNEKSKNLNLDLHQELGLKSLHEGSDQEFEIEIFEE